MRVLKILLGTLLAAVAVLGGLVVAAVVAAAALLTTLLFRLVRRPRRAPDAQSPRRPMRSGGVADVIDVTATEVPVEPRQPDQLPR